MPVRIFLNREFVYLSSYLSMEEIDCEDFIAKCYDYVTDDYICKKRDVYKSWFIDTRKPKQEKK